MIDYVSMKEQPWQFARYLLLVLLLSPISALAQVGASMEAPEPISSPDQVTDQELVRFALSSDRIGEVQQEARERIVSAVEESGLGMERFVELASSFNDPNLRLDREITQEEEEILNRLEPRMVQIELDAREKVFVELAQEGMDVARYQQIFHALQNFPSLQDRMTRLSDEP